MGSPRAKATVALRDPEDGTVRVFVEGDQLPGWALDVITNPEVVDDPGDGTGEDPKPKTRARRKSAAK